MNRKIYLKVILPDHDKPDRIGLWGSRLPDRERGGWIEWREDGIEWREDGIEWREDGIEWREDGIEWKKEWIWI